MALQDKHQLKFNSHKDAKTLMEAIEKRFNGNTKTKKVQKTILKQQFENFTGSSSEGLDQIHDRLQKLVIQLEIHGVSLSQEDVNLKFLRSLPSEWKTHTLIWRNKVDLEEQNLDDLFNSLKIYETKVKQSSSSGTVTQNLAFVSSTSTDSTTDSVSAVASVFVAFVKLPASPLLNVDSLSNAVIYSFFASQSTSPQFDNKDLKQIDVDDLKEMDLKWQMAMLTMRARRFLQQTGRNLSTNGTASMGFDMSKVECYNFHRKGHFAKECRSSKDQRRPGTAEPQRRIVSSYQADEEPANFALMAFSSSSSFDNEVFTKAIFDCENYYSLESNGKSWPPSNLYDRFQPNSGYHVVPPSYTGTFMPPKPDLVFNTAPIPAETGHLAFNHVKTPRHSVEPIETTFPAATSVPASPKSNSSGKRRNRKACFYVLLTQSKPQKHRVHTAVLTQSKLVSNTAVRLVSAALPNITVTSPRHANQVVTKSKLPIHRHLTRNPSSRTTNSPPKVNADQVPVVSAAPGKQGTWGNPQLALQDKGVINSGCSRHMTGNMSYLSDFKELNRGYVAFRGNLKGGKITGKGKIRTGKLEFDNVYFVKELKFNLFSVSQMCDKKNSVLFTDTECLVLSSDFKLPDESQMLLRVPRENNMYNVNLKNIVPSGDLTCLFAKTTLDESNLRHRRLAHIPIPFWAEAVNTACCVQNKVLVTKPNNKTPYELLHGRTPSIGFMRPFGCHVTILNTLDSLGFQDKFDAKKAGEEVDQSYMLFPVWSSVGSTNPQNNAEDAAFDGNEHNFDVKKPESKVILSPSSKFQDCSENSSNKVTTASSIIPTVGQNLLNSTNTFSVAGPSNTAVSPTYGDASQFPDDSDMPGLEDIIYSDDEDVVGAKANFTNLESSIPEEPKRVHQALKDPSWIEAMQEELLQFKMHKVWVLVDLPYGKRAIVVRIEAIRLFLAYASFMGFMVYQMDVKSAFLYGTIEKEVYVCQPLGFKDPDHPDKVYKVVKTLYGLHQAPRAWKSTSTPIDIEKPLLKDPDGEYVDCKKQTVMATSSTEAEYVAAASGCAQVLWIQNQLVDYGVFNSPMLHLLRVEMVLNSPWIMPILGIQKLASPKANGS
uniref:Ribonuclease H-like domain-containing protein n=1 Tax=Tanacetum cinerariifolium TaxID=118510 RepID=A0A6L2J910_TANCI|nr:ribonuclease H-like domain-containing protein [Tanacetum cinerariifolium]